MAGDVCLKLKSNSQLCADVVPRFQRAGPGRAVELPAFSVNVWGVSAGSSGEAGAAAAETAVDVCLGLKRNSQLWADVVPRFQRAGALGQLLGCLLPRIMSGQLQSLAPEVMQVPSQAPHIWRSFLTVSSPAVTEALLAPLAPVHVHVCASPFMLSQAIPAFSGCQVMDAAPGDKLVHVPVQALVEQCSAAGRVGDVERCVLRLDLATLDFNQVMRPSLAIFWHIRHHGFFGSRAASSLSRSAWTLPIKLERCVSAPAQVTRLCRTHHLHSALAFLFTHALSDYAAPAAELLLAHAHGPPEGPYYESKDAQAEWGTKAKTGYKLLVFLKCGLSGKAFPPGERPSPHHAHERCMMPWPANLLGVFLGSSDSYITQTSTLAGASSL